MSFLPEVPEKNLFVLVGDQRRGPFTREDLRTKFAAKEIGRATYLWYPGLNNWITVGDLPEFNRRDEHVPPTAPAAVRNEVWVYERGQVVSKPFSEIEAQAKEGVFRRADLIYSDSDQKWVRADQHPTLTVYFTPSTPPPGPSAELIAASQTELSTKHEADPQAVPASGIPAPSKRRFWKVAVGLAVFAVLGGGITWMRNSLRSRSARPSAAAPVINSFARFAVVVPLNMPMEKVLELGALTQCEKNIQSDAGTLSCAKLNAAFDSFRITFAASFPQRIEGRFTTIGPAAATFYAQLIKRFGPAAKETPYSCENLSPVQKELYEKYCSAGALALQHWSDSGIGVRILVAKGPVDVPLEVQAQKDPASPERPIAATPVPNAAPTAPAATPGAPAANAAPTLPVTTPPAASATDALPVPKVSSELGSSPAAVPPVAKRLVRPTQSGGSSPRK